jgi:hypothetical protein
MPEKRQPDSYHGARLGALTPPGVLLSFFFFCLLGFAAPAAAQSSIAGQVTDESGGVLPGVTVEVASPVLIEKVRSAVTDTQGRYDITNLRPGEYTVTFTLTGFSSVRRQGLNLPDNFTATANAVLKVGNLQETITVTGESPVVDVQRVQQTQVVSRQLLDVLPTGKSYRSAAGLVTAVRPHKQSVADSGPLAQNLNSHGMGTQQTIVLFDGITTNSFIVGQAGYANDAAVQEISYQTTANTADVEVGGLRANLVPRDGGNAFHGGGFFGDLEGKWQADNNSDALKALGLTQQNTTRYSRDVNPWVAGPAMRDRVWFLGSFRRTSNSQIVAQAFYRDGRPGINNISITNATARLTMQVTPHNKVSAHFDRVFRSNPDFVSPGQIVEESSKIFDPKHGMYVTEQLKWTSTIGSRVLFEAGWGQGIYRFLNDARPATKFERGTPEWFTHAPHSDTVLAKTWKSANYGWSAPTRDSIMTSLSYVTGSHNVKAGVDQQWGEYISTNDQNADLAQIYLNGVPSFVDVSATPNRVESKLRSELGIFIMDSWRYKRLTADLGIRFDYFNAYQPAQGLPAGRFVPGREIPVMTCLPCFSFQPAPRLGVAYDLFGNGRTALKGGVYRYNNSPYLVLTQAYSPLNQPADRRTWRDLNGDDIAQDSETGPSNNLNFLTAKPNRRPAADLRRPWVREYTLGVQHQLVPGVAVSAAWDLRQFRNLIVTRNTLAGPSDYTPFVIANPMDGTPLTIFRLNDVKRGLIDLVDTTATDPDRARQTYTGWEFNVNARLPYGASAFGGFILERSVSVTCDVNDPNLLRFCDQSGKLYQELGAVPAIPYRKNIKFSGSQPLPYGVTVAAAFQSYGGTGLCTTDCAEWLPVTYTVPSGRFPGGQTQSVTVNLASPGTRFVDRWTQLDLSFQKTFKARHVEYQGMLQIFNVTNANSILNQNTSFGPRLGQPLEILTGRVPRLGVQVTF